MDRRELSRIDIKFGKFFDPFLILMIIAVLTTSVLAVRSITPRTFSGEQTANVLGLQENERPYLDLVRGEHNYITTEKLEETSETSFKYTAIIKKAPQGRISKPILKLKGVQEESNLKIHLSYTNSRNTKVSIFDKSKNTNYILQQDKQNYSQNIAVNNQSEMFYLVIENQRPVFFNQYVEINFFLNL